MKKYIGFLVVLSIFGLGNYKAQAAVPVCNTTSVPSVTVLSPNGEEIYTSGQQITVTWKSCNLPVTDTMKVSIGYYGPGSMNPTNTQNTVVTTNVGSAVVTTPTIPNSVVPSLISGTYYKVVVSDTNTSPTVADWSDDFFTINTFTAAPSITVLSPNGGETYSAGQDVNVKWKTNNMPNPRINISLLNLNNVVVGEITDIIIDDGQEMFKLPATAEGQYRFEINTKNYGTVSDVSDNTFTITSTGTAGFKPGCSSNSGYSATTGQTCADGTNLISYWYGKVNQHISNSGSTNKSWATDPDGVSGADIDMLTYCQKWYPNTTKVEPFKNQTLINWKNRGNLSGYTSTRMAYSCVQGTTNPSLTLLSPQSGSTFYPGQYLNVRWTGGLSNEMIDILVKKDGVFYMQTRALNDGQENVRVPLFTKAGRYDILFRMANSQNNVALNQYETVTFYVGTNNSSVTISGVSGPQTLNVNQTGTWKISASDPNGGNLMYSVVWGDEAVQTSSTTASRQIPQQTATFTHGYSNSGTYTPTFTVTNDNGQSATTSQSVIVGNGSINVCPVGCACFEGVTTCPVIKDGCSNGEIYSSTTGQACLANGCLHGEVYSSTTGQKCNSVIVNPPCSSTEKGCYNPNYLYTTTPSTSTNTIINTPITRILKVGVKGEDVKAVQSFLGIKADGSFGPMTKAKVMEWQALNNLTPDGLFGYMSLQKANLKQ